MEILSIVEGHANLVRKKFGIANDEVELLATLRERVCRDQCTENKGKTFLFIDDKNKERCGACNCVMEAAWRAVDKKCPFRKW